jgi:hypothetical protein
MWYILGTLIKGSWKTTAVTVLGAIGIMATQLQNLLDDDPATVFSWEMFWVAGVLVLVGLFAKDGDKTSEEVGLK